MSMLQAEVGTLPKREFAEFAFSRTWDDLRQRTVDLEGSAIELFMASERETWLLFGYRGYRFCLHGRGTKLHFTVDDGSCDEAVLADVLRHFAQLLSPGTND